MKTGKSGRGSDGSWSDGLWMEGVMGGEGPGGAGKAFRGSSGNSTKMPKLGNPMAIDLGRLNVPGVGPMNFDPKKGNMRAMYPAVMSQGHEDSEDSGEDC